ncbi:hypothetical protein PYTT13_12705 [Paracoccus yeei]|uniref:Tyr recombinase domain-containing protein n=2 Tax=Paracoccus yeei TaxID=147645 RepID=A0A2D2C2C3_9RHOB|nr:hypothetical protein PYTT13_12705 [Paracoccus yeei]
MTRCGGAPSIFLAGSTEMSKNLIRRGDFYHYRRRIPATAGGGVMQIPLMTDQLADGRRLAMILAVEQDRALSAGNDANTVRGLLTDAARKEAALATLGLVSIPADAERRPTLPPAPRGFDPSISAVVDRLLARKKEDGVGRAQDTQIRAVSRLFVDAIDETDIRAVTQGHLAAFRDVMSRLPKSHGKSERQRGKPIRDIIDAARSLPPAKVGLAPATVNRNLEIVRQILRSAATEGIQTVEGVDTSRLRRRDTIRARDKRAPFSADDCRAVFRSPIWTGSKSEKRRRFPGGVIIKDALFWVPIIAAYTGARREEIAGLMPEDVAFEEGAWVFRIRPNRLRPGLKTAASARVIPAHRDLVRAGFFSGLVGSAGRKIAGRDGSDDDGPEGLLLPGLTRKHAAAGWGESLAFVLDKVLDDTLGDGRAGKSFHSFRHYVTDELRRAGVQKEVRLDILGHAGADLEDEVYGSSSTIPAMQAAINLLPSVLPAPILRP